MYNEKQENPLDYQRFMGTPIEEVLGDVLSPVIIRTMISLGFTEVRDIWNNPDNVLREVPSYGPIKHEKAMASIQEQLQAFCVK